MNRRTSLLVITLALPTLAAAQNTPGAGRLLRETAPPSAGPGIRPSPLVTPQRVPVDSSAAAGTIPVKAIRITGNTVIPTEELRELVASAEGRNLTLNDLRLLAYRISLAYEARGYTLTTAYVPAQTITDGVVTIAVQEVRLGATRLYNYSDVSDSVLRRYLRHVPANRPISTPVLEDALLRLREVPGLQTSVILEPGAAPGTTELSVGSPPVKALSGSVNLDNAGAETTGTYRLGVGAQLASPLGQGDRLAVQGLTSLDSGQGLRYGRVAYDYALGGRGLRIGAGYSHLSYELGQNFKELDASGTADVAQLWLSRPLIRSRTTSVDARLAYDHRDLDDRSEATFTFNPRRLQTLALGVSAGRHDEFMGGGYTAGSVTVGYSQVDIRDAIAALQDAASARVADGAGKLEAQAERTQTLFGPLSLYLRANGQLAGGNLDSADQIGATGPYAVRAYAQGELYGDEAALFTAELRYRLPLPVDYGYWQAVAFYDQATVWLAKDPWQSGDNQRTLGGAGLGLRCNLGNAWSARADAAWRTLGGRPQASSGDTPQVWASLGYAF